MWIDGKVLLVFIQGRRRQFFVIIIVIIHLSILSTFHNFFVPEFAIILNYLLIAVGVGRRILEGRFPFINRSIGLDVMSGSAGIVVIAGYRRSTITIKLVGIQKLCWSDFGGHLVHTTCLL